MSSSSISVGHDKSCVLELILEVNLRLHQVTNVVLPLGVVDSDEVTEIKDELAELCTIMVKPLQVILTQWLLLNTDGKPLASDDQSPSYTPTDDPPILPVNEACDSLPTYDEPQTGH